MSSLREIKDRIGSVRSTLKITSAMKLVASAKLRKAQQAVEALRPYESTLSAILADVRRGGKVPAAAKKAAPKDEFQSFAEASKVAVVAVASNSSLCGSFNGNVVRHSLEVLGELRGEGNYVDVFPIGRRIADPLRKAGYTPEASLNELVAHPSYEAAAFFAKSLADAYEEGRYSKVILIYNHFVSSSRQEVVCETYLPFAEKAGDEAVLEDSENEFILEPSASSIVETLLPQVMRLKIYAMLLDSVAAEHAARMIAMQTATDNAQDILDELTLEYNKGRQQQITSEILDIVGGSQQ